MPQVRTPRAVGLVLTVLVFVGLHAAESRAAQASGSTAKPGQTAPKPAQPAPKPVPTVAPTGGTQSSPGIIFVDVNSDTITTIRTAQNIVTRVALPGEAKEAICGDLFDSTSNTGSFVISRTGNDVFIKPVASKGQTNLFIKTDRDVYNFDLVVVPPAQAYRVVNINLPPYAQQIEQQKAAARREIAEERSRMQDEIDDKIAARQRELDQQNADTLATEQRKLRAEADRRAGDMATRRFVDGIMQGFPSVPLRERRAQLDQMDLTVDDSAFIFEGKLYVRYRLANNGAGELTYAEPKLVVRGVESDRPVTSTTYTARGDYKAPAGQTASGVVVFERPALERGERLILMVRGESKDRVIQLRLLEQTQ
ncbi:MAG TPA: TrbG/VirB9 family P-type conjugative transfer protein [Blastocatellia bacterium]|nr:TrbG/VirB9 family P-type conjugative transfer protein [Blastocatellia bacterium]